jgi:hypothetical protein
MSGSETNYLGLEKCTCETTGVNLSLEITLDVIEVLIRPFKNAEHIKRYVNHSIGKAVYEWLTEIDCLVVSVVQECNDPSAESQQCVFYTLIQKH